MVLQASSLKFDIEASRSFFFLFFTDTEILYFVVETARRIEVEIPERNTKDTFPDTYDIDDWVISLPQRT